MTALDALWDAYASAVVEVRLPDGVLRVRAAEGAVAQRFPAAFDGRAVHVVTAHDPGGVVTDPVVNDAAHERLVAEVTRRGLTSWSSAGGDDSWTHVEESLVLAGLTDDEACSLGTDLGQLAVYVWAPDSWTLLACDGSRRLTSGWRLLDVA